MLSLILMVVGCLAARAQECEINTAYINYGPIPQQARAQGSVVARYTVDETGQALADTYETTQPMLVQSLRSAVLATKFPKQCAGEHTATVEFKIREHASYDVNRVVEVLGPSSYRLTIDTRLANIDTAPLSPVSGLRRVLRRIFRR
jgi:hypothetical protein